MDFGREHLLECLAARGADCRYWPWGNEWHEGMANTEEAGLKETGPVGLFPEGANGLGDMAGNVWEWTHSCWGKRPESPEFGYPYRADDGREDPDAVDLRVIRGGSWASGRRNARCACRRRDIPDYYVSDLGFRVLFSLVDSES